MTFVLVVKFIIRNNNPDIYDLEKKTFYLKKL